MDLGTIEMEPEVAEQRFREYRDAVRQRHSDEDAAIMRGYKALSKGQSLVKLSEALRAGGWSTHPAPPRLFNREGMALPRLAIQHAEEPYVYALGIRADGGMTFFWSDKLNVHAVRRNTYAPPGTFQLRGAHQTASGWSRQYWQAMVPIVPPALRPARGLAGYHVLWEADWKWAAPPRPPRDPALLKHLGGDLYVVVATWELTELERAVLTETR